MGRVDAAIAVWEECLEYHRAQEDLNRVADLHRKIGAGLWHKGERKQAIERYQKGINLLKDGPPCLELVRLYEEAASLYMHAGDNMLAIYASEKALRLAERMGETRAASRAHGIFGRVFGRIGDTAEGAREPRALGRAGPRLRPGRDDPRAAHARPSPRGLGGRLRRARATPTPRRSSSARQIGELPAQVELHSALAQLAVYRADWDGVRELDRGERRPGRARGPGRQALLPLRAARAAGLARRRTGTRAEEACRRAYELADQVGWSEVAFSALYWLAIDAARPRRLPARRRPSSTARSTSASARA